MSHFVGSLSPVDAGLSDFKECLKELREGHPQEALQHARRALGSQRSRRPHLFCGQFKGRVLAAEASSLPEGTPSWSE